jgi:(1->4)-alpha-D-glucan 1-alpha-D-glucosylmutase
VRRRYPQLFQAGEYLPLVVEGRRADHVCAFASIGPEAAVLTVAPRWFARLPAGESGWPLGEAAWADTRIALPPGVTACQNVLTGERIEPVERLGRSWLALGTLLARFPVALLVSTGPGGAPAA